MDIAEGEEGDLTDADGSFDPAQALTVAVDAVRVFLARRECAHDQPRDEKHLFCSLCGLPKLTVGRPDSGCSIMMQILYSTMHEDHDHH